MRLLSRRSHLAVAAILDVALHARGAAVPGKAIAARLGLPARALEPLLQTLVRDGFLAGARGPRGGYTLARERRRIRLADVLAAAELDEPEQLPGSPLMARIVMPALAEAATDARARLEAMTLEELCRQAEAAGLGRDTSGEDFAI
ncbi:RrF2 family transcriptional regulator [Blastochloris viridis]|uniref:HTH-type transcriptional regulator iscR n=1 Tax=Blastochloris viridis TaxID=1079 RepID=A0A0H5BFD7_BLAVI|nr:Rrf2 family transcriptional regulator [Blastochloris viridis]BAR99071.1 predicted transcriptional regulator of cysteine synthase [Blastochloris viridis]CUU43608.1 HTH-type transcriptional regulator iscR [Blastochloris viridis]